MTESNNPITADELRARFQPRIEVPVPGGGVIVCRRPDPRNLFLREIIPLPLLARISARMEEDGGGKDSATERAPTPPWPEFVDRWVAQAAIVPRIVLTREEANADAIWIEDLPFALREAIFEATHPKQEPRASLDAAADFPGNKSVRTDVRDAVPAVEHPAVSSVGSD